MKLIGSATSPYVRKVRVYIEETGAECEFMAVDAWQPNAERHAMAPLGKVPVLIRNDGSTLFDSLLVLEYLDHMLPEAKRLLPGEGEARWDVLRWHALAHGLIDATVVRLLEFAAARAPSQQRRQGARGGSNRPCAGWPGEGDRRKAMALPRSAHARRCRPRRCLAVHRLSICTRLARATTGAGSLGGGDAAPAELHSHAAAGLHAGRAVLARPSLPAVTRRCAARSA